MIRGFCAIPQNLPIPLPAGTRGASNDRSIHPRIETGAAPDTEHGYEGLLTEPLTTFP